MRRAWLAVLLASVSLGALASESGPARSFIDEMVRGVGAEPVRCPVEVRQGTQSRDLRAVCARFDGDFDTFSTRWSQHLSREASLELMDGRGRFPAPTPHSGWQDREGTHEIIYAVGSTVVGVRFQRGEVLLVYK